MEEGSQGEIGWQGRGVRGKSGEVARRVGSQGGRERGREGPLEGGDSRRQLWKGLSLASVLGHLSGLQEGKSLLPYKNSPSSLSLNKHGNQTSKPEGSHPSCARVSGLAGITLF